MSVARAYEMWKNLTSLSYCRFLNFQRSLGKFCEDIHENFSELMPINLTLKSPSQGLLKLKLSKG